jgi:thiol-disulfide isomerase/thioredoxin
MRCLPSTLAAVLASLVLAGTACKQAPAVSPSAAAFGFLPAPGQEAPAFELPGSDGKRVSLASLRGQVVFVNFWATWCGPCQEEMPSMMALGQELEARNPGKFKMVAVSVDDGWQPIQKFFAAASYKGSTAPLVVLLDQANQSSTAAMTLFYCAARGGCPREYKLPESYIVDRRGRLVAYVVGPRDWSDPRAREYLEQLVR